MNPNPPTLDDLFESARHWAQTSYEEKGDMPPTLFPIPADSPSIIVQPLLGGMETPRQKDQVALACCLLNAYHNAAHCVLALDVWMSKERDGTPPREAVDRIEMIMLLGESRGLKKQRAYKIIRYDNEKFCSLSEMDMSDLSMLSGRFVGLLPPIDCPPSLRAVAGEALASLGIMIKKL